jgi:hypothetical protein
MTVVQKGDWISLSPLAGKDTTIEWQQDLVKRSKVFKVIPFVGKENDASGTLFLETNLAEKFLALCEEDKSDNPFATSNNYKVQVTNAIQYGQDNADDPKIRFLVFHDKSDNIYQHRFMQTQAFGSVMYSISDKVGNIAAIGTYLDKIADLGKAFIGDPLRDF